jgi:hypothetical protein
VAEETKPPMKKCTVVCTVTSLGTAVLTLFYLPVAVTTARLESRVRQGFQGSKWESIEHHKSNLGAGGRRFKSYRPDQISIT